MAKAVPLVCGAASQTQPRQDRKTKAKKEQPGAPRGEHSGLSPDFALGAPTGVHHGSGQISLDEHRKGKLPKHDWSRRGKTPPFASTPTNVLEFGKEIESAQREGRKKRVPVNRGRFAVHNGIVKRMQPDKK